MERIVLNVLGLTLWNLSCFEFMEWFIFLLERQHYVTFHPLGIFGHYWSLLFNVYFLIYFFVYLFVYLESGGRFKFEFGLKFRYEVEFEFNLEG